MKVRNFTLTQTRSGMWMIVDNNGEKVTNKVFEYDGEARRWITNRYELATIFYK